LLIVEARRSFPVSSVTAGDFPLFGLAHNSRWTGYNPKGTGIWELPLYDQTDNNGSARPSNPNIRLGEGGPVLRQ
jgi:hypothetical protein